MSEKEPSRVFMFDGDDPEMAQASQTARENFRYFWRELAWERRRIVPGLDLACVKAPFSDGDAADLVGDTPKVEQMWMSEINFDGRVVSGSLLNSPNWLTSVKQGDTVSMPLGRISDWMYAIRGEVFGAYTVQLLRSRMGRAERAEHDGAWGLNFGDPANVRAVPAPKAGGGVFKRWFNKPDPTPADASGDHPMSISMAPSLREAIAKDPTFLTSKDDDGWTILHHLALAGSSAGIAVLLEAGADPKLRTGTGKTASQLARSLGWDEVAAMLER